MKRFLILLPLLFGLHLGASGPSFAGIRGLDVDEGDAYGQAALPTPWRVGVLRGRLFDDDGRPVGQFVARLRHDGTVFGHGWTIWGRGPVIGEWGSDDDEFEFDAEVLLPRDELEIEGEWEGARAAWEGEWELND